MGRRRRAVTGVCVAAALLAGLAPSAVAADEPGSISGQVMTDEPGLPPEGLCVEAHSGLAPPVVATTDILGRYTLDVEPGAYLVGFNTCEEHTAGLALEWWDDVVGLLASTPVFVEPGEAVTGIDASLGPSATVSGTVTDETTGEPLTGSCVLALNTSAFVLARGLTGDDGTYALGNLPAGRYQVAFGQCTDDPVYVPEAWDDHPLIMDSPEAQPDEVAVEAGDTVPDVDAALELGGLLAVEVTAAHTGQPLPLACVAARQGPDLDRLVALTFAGVEPFDISINIPLTGLALVTLPAGEYGLEINGPLCADDSYETSFFDQASGPADAVRLNVDPGEVVDGLTVVLRPRPSVERICGSNTFTGFEDVGSDSPHAVAIGCMSRLGIVQGRTASRFRPGDPVRRDQMASLLARTLEQVGVALPDEAPDAFDDDAGSPHEVAINQLAAMGLLSGTGTRRFSPEAGVTRGQAASLIVAAYELATDLSLLPGGDPFADDDGDVHEPSTSRAAFAALVTGIAPGRYEPSLVLRRDQAATIVARLLNRVSRDSIGGSMASQDSDSAEATATFEPAALAVQRRLATNRPSL